MRDLGFYAWEADFFFAVQQATRRVVAEINQNDSRLAGETLKWIARRCDVQQLEKYFIHLQALPLLALPWWLEASLGREIDRDFQVDLMTSSAHGYFFMRLIDDLMDGHEIDRACLPSLHLFTFRFQSIYFQYFPSSDPFWGHFERSLALTAGSASAELSLPQISEQDFFDISARKTAAACIPLAAVCCRHGAMDRLPAWEEFLTLFARWHQMRDDILDWSEDDDAGRKTWFLSEAQRRKGPNEAVAVWMGRTGLPWAAELMDGWMQQMRAAAPGLDSAELVRYLQAREDSFSRQISGKLRLAAACEALLQL